MLRRIIIFAIVCVIFASCAPVGIPTEATKTPGVPAAQISPDASPVEVTRTPTVGIKPVEVELICSWRAPDDLPLQIANRAAQAVGKICLSQSGDHAISLGQPALLTAGDEQARVEWVYVVAARFPTVTDDIELGSLQLCWMGRLESCPNGRPILASQETTRVFSPIWGKPGSLTVRQLDEAQLLETAWRPDQNWAIIPFEALEPRWKVMKVDGIHPLHRQDALKYPLRVGWEWVSPEADVAARFTQKVDETHATITNLDFGQLTTLAMTGTTALTRGTALLMEEKGINYPATDVGQLLSSADITHISNEVSFTPDCPKPSEKRKGVRFCSQPAYIQLLGQVGADVVELTGNHVNDWGRDAFLFTLNLYKEKGIPYYGGGVNTKEAQQAITLEKNGSQLAFIGCNLMGPQDAWALADEAGSAPCDFDWMEKEVKRLDQEGYVVIVTLQHFEVDNYLPQSKQRSDFLRMAEAGAAIVSGSQAHFPQIVTFDGNHFIHFGLGNLFFDQMTEGNRRAFIDMHTIYQGRLISTELVTIMMEEAGKPRFMTLEERQALLSAIFSANGW